VDHPVCLLLLPRPLDAFILRDQAEDLLRAEGVIAADPPPLRYGAFARLPAPVAARLARTAARRLLRRVDGDLRALVIFHPVQWPLARAVLAARPRAELWYGRWDRYEMAYDASPKLRARLADLHEQAASRAAMTFVASEELARLEREAGREPTLVALAADRFPAHDPGTSVVAVSLGHLGRRCDWALLRGVCERVPELTVLAIGELHEDEIRDGADAAWCQACPQIVWLGPRDDEEAARLIGCADVGIVPFAVEPFNDAGLPYRILKYARQGVRTVTPALAGVQTWAPAVTAAADADAFAAALRAHAGRRANPDLALRDWALAQTAERQNGPLWERLAELGITP
jgi:hypothetical protein